MDRSSLLVEASPQVAFGAESFEGLFGDQSIHWTSEYSLLMTIEMTILQFDLFHLHLDAICIWLFMDM
jgi:hypothetical protein